MKTLLCVLGCALTVIAFATVAAAAAGPSANGEFDFGFDGASGSVQFNARTQSDGQSSGQMVFTATMDVPDGDVDGTGEPTLSASNLALGIAFDCLEVDGNRAAMSGVITSANVDGYTGRKAVLVVADNEEGVNAPDLDKFTWGVYVPQQMTWIPSDAEVPDDDGAMLTWTATDAERTDDVGIPSAHGFPVVDCHSFSLDAYTLVSLDHGAGNIQVRP